MLKRIKIVLIAVSLLWGILIVDLLFDLQLTRYGIFPRSIEGLRGVLFSPFLHAGYMHLLSNTFPLIVLLSALVTLTPSLAKRVIVYSILLGGMLLWCIGRESIHIGSSGLIYSLAFFLVLNGIYRRSIRSLIIALVVALMYSELIWGILPSHPWISWEGHLTGAIAGAFIAYYYRKKPM